MSPRGEAAGLELSDVEVRFGPIRALKGINLEVAPGDVVGLIGPNGAGKTTTLNVAASTIRPTNGSVRVDGRPLREGLQRARARIGYMPELFGVYDDMRLREYLRFFALAYHLPHDSLASRIEAALDRVRLSDRQESYVGTLSKGTKQKLFFAKTLLHDPGILLLDEPFSGLDPVAAREMRAAIQGKAAEGGAVLVASHDLAGLDQTVTRAVAIRDGLIVADWSRGDEPALVAEVTLESDRDAAQDLLAERLPGLEVTAADMRTLLLRAERPAAERQALILLLEAGHDVSAFKRRRLSLHALFERALGA